MTTHFFLGANSGEGFQSLYPDLADLEKIRDLIVLKGGPGVGKSTFMKQVGRAAEEAGQQVEYIWCSGDPDSLDAVLLPECAAAVVDGTSPHVVEPRYPAAVDRYVNLGQFYDVDALKKRRLEVVTHTEAYKEAYQRAFHCLKAARQVERSACPSTTRAERGALRFPQIPEVPEKQMPWAWKQPPRARSRARSPLTISAPRSRAHRAAWVDFPVPLGAEKRRARPRCRI